MIPLDTRKLTIGLVQTTLLVLVAGVGSGARGERLGLVTPRLLVKEIDEIKVPEDVTPQMEFLAEKICQQACTCSQATPLIAAAWALDDLGYLGQWNEEQEKNVIQSLKDGVPIDARDDCGRTALMHAVLASNAGYFNFLRQMSARVDLKDRYGLNVNHLAKMTKQLHPPFNQMAELINKSYKGIDVSNLLYGAVTQGDFERLNHWFKNRVSPDLYNEVDSHYGGLLGQAAENKDFKMMAFLLHHGATITEATVQRALSTGRLKVAQFLFDAGFPTDTTNQVSNPKDAKPMEVWSPYFVAAQYYIAQGDPEYGQFLASLESAHLQPHVLANTYLKLAQQKTSVAALARQQQVLRLLQSKILHSCSRLLFQPRYGQ